MSIYTDAEMQIASLIANLDVSCGESIGHYMSNHSDDSTVLRIREISAACNNGNAGAYDNWRVVGVGNDQNASGMYGCMLDDGNGNAIFSFRGSEGLGEIDNPQLYKDWVEADGGLAYGSETWQQQRAEEFVKSMFAKYCNQYEGYAFTGHSLGGNLAIDAALDSPSEMRDRITQVVGLDSPGFSSEYLISHRNVIRQMSDRITHYQWSVVGALLDTPGTNHSVNTFVYGEHDLSNLDTGTGNVLYRIPDQLDSDELLWKGLVNRATYHLITYWIWSATRGVEGFDRLVHQGDSTFVSAANIVASKVRFEANLSSMQIVRGDFESLISDYNQASEMMEDISNMIKYNSKVGWILKNIIRIESVKVNEMAEQIKKYRNVLEFAEQEYRNADAKAEEAYSGLYPLNNI